ncbi:lea1 [Symbiodinium sp. CCMP2592]|nr:lea1 [Symbiodinium sp. CCMP2592]
MSESSRAAEASAVAAVPAEPCDKLQVSLQQLLRVITDILDSLEQGEADEALSQKLAKYVALLAEVDQRAASLPPLEVPVAVLQHMDQDGGSPSVWCQSLLDRLKNGMEGFKQRKAPVASLSRHLRAQGWGLASLNSLSRPSEAEGQVAGNDMSKRTTKKRPLESTALSSLGSREKKSHHTYHGRGL